MVHNSFISEYSLLRGHVTHGQRIAAAAILLSRCRAWANSILAGGMAFSADVTHVGVCENKLAVISVHVFRLLAQRYKGHLEIYRDISGYAA